MLQMSSSVCPVEVEPRLLQFQVRGENLDGQNGDRSHSVEPWPLNERRRSLTIRAATRLSHGSLVAFKLQTNASKRFSVQPAQGYLRPGEAARVTVLLKPGLGWSDADKFLVRSVEVENDSQHIQDIWSRVGSTAHKIVLRCEFVMATPHAEEEIGLQRSPGRQDYSGNGDKQEFQNHRGYGNYEETEEEDEHQEVEEVKPKKTMPSPQTSPMMAPVKVSLERLGPELEALLLKNLSDAPQDRLSRPQLEQLRALRDKVGRKTWAALQEEARARLLTTQGSPRSAFAKDEYISSHTRTFPTSSSAGAPSDPPTPGSRKPQLGAPSSGFSASSRPQHRSTPISTAATTRSYGQHDAPLDPLDLGPAGNHAASYAPEPKPSPSSQQEVAAMLSRAIEQLDARRTHEAITTFRRARELVQPQSMQRAQVDVGLGSAYEAAGFLDNGIGCYVDAARLYDALGEQSCMEQVCGAIGHVYADMRDHAKAAAWFDEQLSLCGNDPEHGNQRATIMMARDHQLKIGHVTSSRLEDARNLVQDILRGLAPPPVVVNEDVHVPGHEDAVNGSAVATGPVETLWEPGASLHRPVADTNRDQEVSQANSLAPLRIAPSSRPNYLSATRASTASRFNSERDRKPRSPELDPLGPAPVYVDPVSARVAQERSKAATAQHVKRSLEARRLRDQNRGVKPPLVRRISSEDYAPETLGEEDSTETIVYLDVYAEMDGQSYSVALPGPLNIAKMLTVREMREKVSFVTGVELHDFELIVENTPLADSWTGGDIGIGVRTEVALRLLPGVRPQKYVKAVRTSPTNASADQPRWPHNLSEEAHVETPPPSRRRSQPNSASDNDNESIIQPPPSRPPPPPAADDASSAIISASPSPIDVDQANGLVTPWDGGDDIPRVDSLALTTTSPLSNLGDLLKNLEDSLKSRQEADHLADHFDRDVLEALGGFGDYDAENQASPSPRDNQLVHIAAGSAAAELTDRILGLEKQLAKSEEARSKLELLVDVTKSKLADATTGKAQNEHMKRALKREVSILRSDFKTLASETRAALTNFNEVLRHNMRTLHAAIVQEDPVLIALLRKPQDQLPEQGESICFPDAGPSGAAFVPDHFYVLSDCEQRARKSSALSVLASAIAQGQAPHAFIVGLGAPVALFGKKEDPSILIEQVRAIFQAFSSTETPMRVRAIAVEEDNCIVDLLNPNQERSNQMTPSIEIGSDGAGADIDVRFRNSVAVKFRTSEDFQRLFNVLRAQLRHQPRLHIAMLLEDEPNLRKVLFAQVSVNAQQVPEAMRSILKASAAPHARTIVLAGLEDGRDNDEVDATAPNTSTLLSEYYSIKLSDARSE